MTRRILVVNPGSTSTKVSVFDDGEEIVGVNVTHDEEALAACDGLMDQLPLRRQAILSALEGANIPVSSISAIAARGGTFGKVEGGAYVIDEALVEACKHPKTNHPSNLAAVLAAEIGDEYGIPGYIYDAVCTDETRKLAHLSGLRGLNRKPNSHVLNSRAVCRAIARQQGWEYEKMRFVVAHMGGGISLNVHDCGRIVDVVSDDEGPMSPERAGCLNTVKLAELCYSGKYDRKTMLKNLKGAGGLISHLGVSDLRQVEERISAGDDYAKQVFDTMSYQIAKSIGALATVVFGRVDAIILTGGMAYSKALTDLISQRVRFLSPVYVVPGAMEMQALADGIERVLAGVEMAKQYSTQEEKK